ncbi:MAG: CDP-alcohol phosphatidyltransferase family protein [Treponema sp.]
MADYSYKANDESLLTPFLYKYFVDPFVKMLSPRIPANFITLISFLFVIASFGIAVHGYYTHSYDYWFLIPIFVFMYLVGDCSDGKQARKTGTGSPLGEYFDHFLDSFVTGLLMGILLISFQSINPIAITIGLFILYFGQITTFWERYTKGVMHFNRVSTSEGILTIAFSSWLTSFPPLRHIIIQYHFLGFSYGEIALIGIMVFGLISTACTTLFRTGVSFRLLAHLVISCILTFLTAYFFHTQMIYVTLLITCYNALFLASLLAATALKTQTALPDFIIPLSFCGFLFFPAYTQIIQYTQIIYLAVRIAIRFSLFVKIHKHYWYWINPVVHAGGGQ